MGRKPKPADVVEEALALCRDEGMSPQDAAAEMQRRGKTISWRTIHTARQRAEQELHAATVTAPPVPADDGTTRGVRVLDREKLAGLVSLVARLPLSQQDDIVAATPLYQRRVQVVAAALAPFPEAARAYAQALIDLDKELR